MYLLEELLSKYGADYEDIMIRFMGNEELYCKLFPKLLKDDSFEELEKVINSNDLKGAFKYARTLKGIIANLGLTSLYDKIYLIIKPLKLEIYYVTYLRMYEDIKDELLKAEEQWENLSKRGVE